jgi:hypothetical protein
MVRSKRFLVISSFLLLAVMTSCTSLTAKPSGSPPGRDLVLPYPPPDSTPTSALHYPPVMEPPPATNLPPANTTSVPYPEPTVGGSPGDVVVSPPYPAPGYETPPAWMPAPGDEKLVRGEVFIDEKQLLTLEIYPPQVMLHLKGSLPTPCHQLRVKVNGPDDQNSIQVEVYSLAKPDEICIQVLAPFDVNIPLRNFPAGKFMVWVNGEKVGEITL